MVVLKGASILIIGASHLSMPSYLGTTLNDALLGKGAQVHSLGVCGSTPTGWTKISRGSCGGGERIGSGPIKLKIGDVAKTVPLPELIATEKPNILVVVLGDTLGQYHEQSLDMTWVNSEMTRFTDVLKKVNTKCYWVGPSWGEEGFESGKTYSRVKQISEVLSNMSGPCTYIDSLKMSSPGEWKTNDGIHYKSYYYKQWGSKIVEQIEKSE